MSVRYVVTFISFVDKNRRTHDGISQVYVVDKTGVVANKWMSVADAHDFISGIGSENLWVEGPTKTIICYARKTASDHKYIQTKSDDVWTDNLLSLPVIGD